MFDLDDTLAESFKPPSISMVEKLSTLLEHVPVAISTAAGFTRIEKDFLSRMQKSAHIDRMYILANSSAECFTWTGGAWNLEYDFALTDEEKETIQQAIIEGVVETGIQEGQTKYEPMVIDRGAQIAYAAIGLEATAEDKAAWDPDQAKRRKLKSAIDAKLANFEVLIGGKTTIDITRKGIHKAYGVGWLSERLKIAPSEMLYIGDALYEGGNDEVVIPTGIQTIQTSGPAETETIVEELCRICRPA